MSRCCNSVIYATLLDWLSVPLSLVSFECCKRFIGIFSANALSLLFLVCPLSCESVTVISVNVKDGFIPSPIY